MSKMASRESADEGFPHDRVRAAKMYLYAVKPWWARFGERMVIVPTYTPPREGAQWGAMTSTDQHLRLYIDRTFAITAPLHLLAGAIEHEFQHHTHDTWKRLRWMDPDEWRDWANIVLDLEINSVIDSESARLDVDKIRSALKESVLFTQRDMHLWDVIAPPGLGEMGWIPRLVGLPDGLSAEEYYRLITKPEGAHDNDTASDETGEDEESQRDSEEEEGDIGSSGDSDQNESESGSDLDSTGDEPGDSQQEGEQGGDPSDDTESNDSDHSDSSDADSDSGNGNDAESGEGDSGDGDSERQEGEGQSDSSDSSAESAPGDSDMDGKGDAGGEGEEPARNGEASQPGEGSGDSDATGESSTPGGITPSPAEAIEEMRSDPINQMWASEIENPADPLSNPAWKPDNPPPAPTPGEIAEALAELEEDVHNERSIVPGFGLGGESRVAKWADDYRKARKMDWGSRFEKLTSSSVNSARIHGQTDMSYAVRNPNQPVLGPIMMGMHGYSPVVYVLQDVSGSMLMNGGMKKSQSAFTELCKTLMGKFGGTVTWFSADREIRDVGRTTRWSEELKSRWSYGWSGTDFGDVIGELMQGKLMHKGKRYPKPDVLIVSSDCQFEWPKIRPRGCKIVVVNVGHAGKADRFLPEWLNRTREYVVVD